MTQGQGEHKGILSKDHKGNLFRSLAAMARCWGLKPCTVWSRLDAGWDIEEALTAPLTPHCKRSCRKAVWKDHLGREYGSIREMCRAWGINQSTFQSRRRRRGGWTIERALTAPAGKQGKKNDQNAAC